MIVVRVVRLRMYSKVRICIYILHNTYIDYEEDIEYERKSKI